MQLKISQHDGSLMLKARDHQHVCRKTSPEVVEVNSQKIPEPKRLLFNECNFDNVDQLVEKTNIDMFGMLRQDKQVISDIHFIGPLHGFNYLLIKDSWLYKSVDFLKLPSDALNA